LFKSFRELRESRYLQNKPIVVFPECTKTNGLGVVNFPGPMVDLLREAQSTFKVHALRFDYEFTYNSPYNSVDVRGLSTAVKLLSQFNNSLKVQFYFNLEKKSGLGSAAEYHQFAKMALQSPGKEYSLDLDYKRHQDFLEYFHNYESAKGKTN